MNKPDTTPEEAQLLLKRLSHFMIMPLSCDERSSFAWKHWGKLIIYENGKKKHVLSHKIFCDACFQEALKTKVRTASFCSVDIKSYSIKTSTGNLINHLRNKHNIVDDSTPGCKVPGLQRKRSHKTSKECSDPNNIVIAGIGSLYDAEMKCNLARDIALWFSKDLLPFSEISCEGLQFFMQKYHGLLAEDFTDMLSLVADALMDIYSSLHRGILESISSGGPTGAISCEMWTDNQRQHHNITFRYSQISDLFCLELFTLSTHLFTESHTSLSIRSALDAVVDKFCLTNKRLFAVTNAAENIQSAVRSTGMHNHVCLGYGIHNLVMKDGIRQCSEARDLVKKVRKIVRSVRFRASELGTDLDIVESFRVVDEQVEADICQPVIEYPRDNSAGSVLCVDDVDIPTRWNTTFTMLQSVEESTIINDILEQLKLEELKLCDSEWKLLKELVLLLCRLNDSVEHLSLQKTSTMNLVLVLRSEIKTILEPSEEDSASLRYVKGKMILKLDERCPIHDLSVAGALLDPRFINLEEIDVYLKACGMDKIQFLCKQIETYIEDSQLAVSLSQSVEPHTSDKLLELAKKHSAIQAMTKDTCIRNECQVYFSTVLPHMVPSGDVIMFWKGRSFQFPCLSSLARTILAIPATSIPSERVFSVGDLVISAKRSNISPDHIDPVIFVHDNYRLWEESAAKIWIKQLDEK